jgi:hypothetical protein
MTELFWFDRLARREIDAALSRVKAENGDRDPGYIVDDHLDGSPARDRCRLSITSPHATSPHMVGAIVIRAAGDRVMVEHHFGWHDEGKAILIDNLDQTHVTQDKIASLARDFVAEFFRRLPVTAKA